MYRYSTCVDLGWVAKRWKTCVDLRANLISNKVSASQRKCTQALAKRSCKLTHVFNLRQLTSPFGQGLKAVSVWPPNASLYASSTCIHLRLLAGPFGQGFMLTWVEIKFASKAFFSPFGHPTQVITSWLTSINLLLANEIEDSLP